MGFDWSNHRPCSAWDSASKCDRLSNLRNGEQPTLICIDVKVENSDKLKANIEVWDGLTYIFCIFIGNLSPRYRDIFYKNPMFTGTKLPEVQSPEPFNKRFPKRCSTDALALMRVSEPSMSHVVDIKLFVPQWFHSGKTFFKSNFLANVGSRCRQTAILLRSIKAPVLHS